ncbi:MAG: endolytic transglycosylase MltG [Candidatus Eisenbacteria sp.]|nr:endolytic transglycosylase MltG [Candidatus Eisenbacteria bacterium]
MRRPQTKWLVIAGVLAVAAAMVAFAIEFYSPKDRNADPVQFEVTPGMSLVQVAARLSEEGLIRSRRVFVLGGRLGRVETQIKTGRFRISATQSAAGILRTLQEGHVALARLTVREGLTVEQTATAVMEQIGIPAEDFLNYVDSLDASSLLGFPTDGMEGFLFPNTYFVSDGAGPAEIVRAMVKAFHEAVGDSFPRRAWVAGLSPAEVVTLASVIEKETRVPEERPRISAVFHNRLRRGWRLEADPTVRYALKRWKGFISYKDLEVESPYNTYRVWGLPPGPIASPGVASIEAAMNPDPAVIDLYFVARGDGSHQFSRTLKAHLRAKAAARD